MISAQTYILFVAPLVMGLGGLVIYMVANRFIGRDRSHSAK